MQNTDRIPATAVPPITLRVRYTDDSYEVFPLTNGAPFKKAYPNLDEHVAIGDTPEAAAANWLEEYEAGWVTVINASGEELLNKMNKEKLQELHETAAAEFDPQTAPPEMVTLHLNHAREGDAAVLPLYTELKGSVYTSRLTGNTAKGKEAALALLAEELEDHYQKLVDEALAAELSEKTPPKKSKKPKAARTAKKTRRESPDTSDIPDADRITAVDLAREAGISPAKARKILRAHAEELNHDPRSRWVWDRNDTETLEKVRKLLAK